MTKEEFIKENIALQGGKKELWEEVFDKFTKNTENTDKITFADFIIGLSSLTGGTDEEKLTCKKKVLLNFGFYILKTKFGRDVQDVRCKLQQLSQRRRGFPPHKRIGESE